MIQLVCTRSNSKSPFRSLAVAVALAVTAVPVFAGTASAQAGKVYIDVDPVTGTIRNGLVMPAGAGNYVTVPVVSRAPAPFLALPTTGSGYAVGELVVPGGGFVSVPILSNTGATNSTIRVWDAKTTSVVNWPDQVGNVANLSVNVTSNNVTKPLGQFVLDQLYSVKPGTVTKNIKVFDYRTNTSLIQAPDVLGTAANLVQPATSNGVEKPLAFWIYEQVGVPAGVALPVIPKLPPPPPPVQAPPVAAPIPTPTAVPSAQPVTPQPVQPAQPVQPVQQVQPLQPAQPGTVTPVQVPVAPAATGSAVATPPQNATLATPRTCKKTKKQKVRINGKLVKQRVCVKYA